MRQRYLPKIHQPIVHRGGYSLLELMIVLAILAAMAAIAAPSLRGPLDKSRLRAAAREIQSSLARSRASAIREGVALVFRYQPGGDKWQLLRTGPSPTTKEASRLSSESDELTNADVAPAGAGFDSVETLIVRDGELPDGVEFAVRTVTGTAGEEFVESDGLDVEIASATQQTWSAPIVLFPNGRSDDAALTLHGQRRFAVKVTLRGLTATVSYSPLYRRAETFEDGVAE